ncbi:unnamed protein product [Bathycoccus prasinos]
MKKRSNPFLSLQHSQHPHSRAKFSTKTDDVSKAVLEDDEAKKHHQIEKRIASSFPRIKRENVVAVLHLLRDECTIPFIARYRKREIGFGSTSGQVMSEVEIKQIKDTFEEEEKKEKFKEKILRTIDEMLLKKSSSESSELERREREKIERAREKIRKDDDTATTMTLRDMEELWRTIKPDAKASNTRANKARERCLEPLAEMIARRDFRAVSRMREEKKRLNEKDEEEIWKGARDILSEWVGNESLVRECAKEQMGKFGRVTCAKVLPVGVAGKKDTNSNTNTSNNKSTPKERREQKALESAERYDNFSALVTHVKPHQILAMNRAETNGTLRVKVELDYARQVIPAAERFMRSFKTAGGDEQKYNKVCEEQIKMACEDGVKRFVKPWAEREMRTQLKEEALKRASLDFAANVKALLLQPPLRPQGTVLALDPGYRAGCKCAVVDKMGNVLETFVCYLHKEMEMKKKIKNVCEQYKVSVIAIGDGTASRETETLVANSNLNIIVDDDDDDKKNDSKNSYLRGWVVTSEAGASIYSASEIATKELPNLDVSLRGAVSIARRVQDPLAELVKLDPKHVGVGMYQHDAKSGALDKELDYVVESAVASVGVDLNTASISLLSRVPGMTKNVAKNIVEEREKRGRAYSSKTDAKTVKGCGAKTFEQIAGFLRVAESDDILDRTAVHTESYDVARKLLKKCTDDASLLETLATGGGNISAEVGKEIGVDENALKDMAKMLVNHEEGNDERLLKVVPALNNNNTAATTTTKTKIQHQNAQIGLNIRSGALTLSTLKKGQTLSGVVKNVCQFGIFVDVGVETSGLIHRSTFCKNENNNKYDDAKKEPHDIARAGEKVSVRVGDVDVHRKRLQLFFLPAPQ